MSAAHELRAEVCFCSYIKDTLPVTFVVAPRPDQVQKCIDAFVEVGKAKGVI